MHRHGREMARGGAAEVGEVSLGLGAYTPENSGVALRIT